MGQRLVALGSVDSALKIVAGVEHARHARLGHDVGLLAEEYDTQARRQTGNFPQALTHIALVNTAQNLSYAKRAAEKPAVQRSK